MLVDLSGRVSGHGVGDICLRHVCPSISDDNCLVKTDNPIFQLKELGTFDCYKTYYDRQDESQRALQAMFKKQSFQTFTEAS